MRFLDRLYARKHAPLLLYSAVALFFLFIIVLPPVYILTYAFKGGFVLEDAARRALLLSFEIAAVVTLIDLLFGLPIAWVLAKGKHAFLDSLVDMPLVIPTTALGFSVFLFWGSGSGISGLLGLERGLFSTGPALIILLHIVFTLPYVIRSVEAAIRQLNVSFEQAAGTLGAKPLTIFRTISLPLFKGGAVVGAVLAFARSLSETGATIVVAGAFATAPVLVVDLKNSGNIPSAAVVSIVLIGVAVVLFLLARVMASRTKGSLGSVYPDFESALSRLAPARNVFLGIFVLLFILAPTFFIVVYALQNFTPMAGYSLAKSIGISLLLAAAATAINLVVSLPLAYFVARNKYGLGEFFEVMNDVVLLVPTSALGLSIALFWGLFGAGEFYALLLAHLSFSFPLLIKPIIVAIKGIDQTLEDASRNLGAPPITTYLKIVLPLARPAVLAGAIMAFMRSVSETGATLAVSKDIVTAPILIVELVKSNRYAEAGFASLVLFGISFILLVLLRKYAGGKNAGH